MGIPEHNSANRRLESSNSAPISRCCWKSFEKTQLPANIAHWLLYWLLCSLLCWLLYWLLCTAVLLCLNFSVWKWLKGVSCSDKMRPVGIGNGSLKIPSILWTFSICGMGDNLKDLWRVMAAIYNFTQVPLTLPLEAAVKNRHGRRVVRGGRRRRNGKRG